MAAAACAVGLLAACGESFSLDTRGGIVVAGQHERRWQWERLGDWVRVADQVSVVVVTEERSFELTPPPGTDPGPGRYVGREVTVEIESTIWQRRAAR